MEPLELGKFVVQLLTWFWDRCTLFTECNQGQAVIKKRFGYPIQWRTKPRWYWKCPFIDMFDKVDMRKRYAQFNVHSFYDMNQENGVIVPYNILIDFQVEYQIINPLVIYDACGYMEGEDIALSYVNNIVHSYLSQLIQEKGVGLSYQDVVSFISSIVEELHHDRYSYDDELKYDDAFLDKKRSRIDLKSCISINDVVITSFDKNISLRTTV